MKKLRAALPGKVATSRWPPRGEGQTSRPLCRCCPRGEQDGGTLACFWDSRIPLKPLIVLLVDVTVQSHSGYA